MPRVRSKGPGALLLWGILLLLLAGCSIPRWPVEGTMTSPFGMRWSGVLPGVHHGVDLSVPEGTAVRSMAPGRVRYAGWMTGFGNVIWIDHRGNTLSVYAHLSRIEVRAGDRVGGGQVIGASGSTGNVSAPHLHFEVWVAGRPVDPVPFLGRRPVVGR